MWDLEASRGEVTDYDQMNTSRLTKCCEKKPSGTRVWFVCLWATVQNSPGGSAPAGDVRGSFKGNVNRTTCIFINYALIKTLL